MRDPKTIKRHAQRDVLIAQAAQRDAEEREIQRLAMIRRLMCEDTDEDEEHLSRSQDSQLETVQERSNKRRRENSWQPWYGRSFYVVKIRLYTSKLLK